MRLEGLIIPVSFDEAGLTGSISSIKGMLRNFGADAAALGVVSTIGAAYVGFLVSTIEPAADAETANVRLAAALKATGRDAEITGPQLAIMAQSMMKMSTFDDESLKAAFQILSQFPSIPTAAFEDLTLAAMDLSAATGENLLPNIEAIGRALETGVIPRTFGFSAALKEQFKDQVAAGDSAAALATMMDGLSRYTGQATAEVTTYNGQVKQLQNNWSEFKENIGSQFIPSLAGLMGWVNKNWDAVVRWADAISDVLFLWKGAGALSKSIAENVQSGWTGAPRVPTGNAWQQAFGSAQQNQGAQQSIDYYKFASILAAEIAKSQ